MDRAKKMEAVRKVVQCTRCLARCAKCGVQFETHEMYKRQKGPYRFCPFCQEEYEDFRRIKERARRAPFTGTTRSGWPSGRPGSISSRP